MGNTNNSIELLDGLGASEKRESMHPYRVACLSYNENRLLASFGVYCGRFYSIAHVPRPLCTQIDH